MVGALERFWLFNAAALAGLALSWLTFWLPRRAWGAALLVTLPLAAAALRSWINPVGFTALSLALEGLSAFTVPLAVCYSYHTYRAPLNRQVTVAALAVALFELVLFVVLLALSWRGIARLSS
jgi:hypothetical protein